MANVRDVADYFLSKTVFADEAMMSNLKLQKLLYYIQGFHLALFDTPIFEDAIEAWRHGPVTPIIYHTFKSNGSNPIPCEDSDKNFNELFRPEQIELLDEVYDVFGQYSAWKLREMTHEEPTWIMHESDATIIPQDEMKEYFKTRIA